MIKTCMHCGCEFNAAARHGSAKTCSPACRKAANVDRARERGRKKRQDPEYRAAAAAYKRTPAYRARQAEYQLTQYRDNPRYREKYCGYQRAARARSKAETISRMLAMLNSGELAAYGTEPYFLYRFYDEDDALLYVGITNDPERRLYEHTAEKPWADDIARTEYTVFANKTEAAAAEAALIKELGPLHNVVHNSVIKIPLTANDTRC